MEFIIKKNNGMMIIEVVKVYLRLYDIIPVNEREVYSDGCYT